MALFSQSLIVLTLNTMITQSCVAYLYEYDVPKEYAGKNKTVLSN